MKRKSFPFCLLAGSSLLVLLGYGMFNKKSDALPVSTNAVVTSTNLEHKVTPVLNFAAARTNESVRQPYLNSIFTNVTIPYCEGIVYDADGSALSNHIWKSGSTIETNEANLQVLIRDQQAFIRKQKLGLYVPSILNLSAQSNSVPLFVGRSFFESSNTVSLSEAQIYNVIEAHEGRHVEQHALGLSYFGKERLIDGIQSKSIRPLIAFGVTAVDADGHALASALRGKRPVDEYTLNELKVRFTYGQRALMEFDARGKLSKEEGELVMGLHEYLSTFPELRDIHIPASHYEQKKRFK